MVACILTAKQAQAVDKQKIVMELIPAVNALRIIKNLIP